MANAYYNVETGLSVGPSSNVVIDATTGNITSLGNISISGILTANGNIVTTGNITINSTTYAYTANSVLPKSYVDNIAVVFGI